jgi:putative transposase
MANTYISAYLHVIFSTKSREPTITDPMRERLWSYLGGIARENKLKALAVGGTRDHVHILLSLPATITIAQALKQIKGASSTWVSKTFPGAHDFAWQIGYGAFSIRAADIPETTAYINNQAEHHRFKSFREEYLHFLDEYGIEYDERYVFD